MDRMLVTLTLAAATLALSCGSDRASTADLSEPGAANGSDAGNEEGDADQGERDCLADDGTCATEGEGDEEDLPWTEFSYEYEGYETVDECNFGIADMAGIFVVLSDPVFFSSCEDGQLSDTISHNEVRMKLVEPLFGAETYEEFTAMLSGIGMKPAKGDYVLTAIVEDRGRMLSGQLVILRSSDTSTSDVVDLPTNLDELRAAFKPPKCEDLYTRDAFIGYFDPDPDSCG